MRSQLIWHSKSEILAATGVAEDQWNTAIRELIARGDIERQGEKRGARYRIQSEGTR
jgi:DNA-binding transcriptional regulator PaaX